MPKLCTWKSPQPSRLIEARIFSRSAGARYDTSITVPPVNSIDRFSPRKIRKPTAIRNVMAEAALKYSEYRMNGIVLRIRKNSIVGFRSVGRGQSEAGSALGAGHGGAGAPHLADRERLQPLAPAVQQVHDPA